MLKIKDTEWEFEEIPLLITAFTDYYKGLFLLFFAGFLLLGNDEFWLELHQKCGLYIKPVGGMSLDLMPCTKSEYRAI